MGFIIATKSRFNEGQTVFMADRKKVRKSCWWTTRLSDAFVFEHRAAASVKAAAFHFNNATVLTMKEARHIERMDDDQRTFDEAMSACEDGWDGHKNAF